MSKTPSEELRFEQFSDQADSKTAKSDVTKLPEVEELVSPEAHKPSEAGSGEHTSLGDLQEFFIPIHGFVKFTEKEMDIINHPAFQRLGKIYQLGQSYLVYRGATHKRLEHCLGTVHVAQKIIDEISAVHSHLEDSSDTTSRCKLGRTLSANEVMFIRLAALLHDIGHLPAGHTLEDELCILKPHDANKRIDLVLGKTDWVPGLESEKLGTIIEERYKENVPAGAGLSATDILKRIISKDEEGSENVGDIRFNICRDIVGNTICADLLDYLYRDWWHIGKPRYFEERLYQYMQIRSNPREDIEQFVISYGHSSRPKRDAVSSVLELLESRYNLAEAVLFHPTKCSAASMLERGLNELVEAQKPSKKDQWIEDLENRLLASSDEEMLSMFLQEAITLKSGVAAHIFQSLAIRRLYKSVCTVNRSELNLSCNDNITDNLIGDRSTAFEKDTRPKEEITAAKKDAANNRRIILTAFEDDLCLPKGSVSMYCPPLPMNHKIAEVKILCGNSIKTLTDWDQSNQKLAGGHCVAQLHRFDQMWRVEIFICDEVLNALPTELQNLIPDLAKTFILGIESDGNLPFENAKALAKKISQIKGSPYYEKQVAFKEAARGTSPSLPSYPTGAPRLKNFF
jgi:HD superfamily phosphohydrolase